MCLQQATIEHYSDPDKFCSHIPALRLSRFSLIVLYHLHGLPSFLLPSCFPTEILHAALSCLINSTHPTCLILLHLIKNVKLRVPTLRRQSVGAELKLHSFLPAEIDEGEWPRLSPRRFNPGNPPPPYPLCWQFDGPHSPSEYFVEEKNL
jgi:hypothetical protein